MEIDNKNSEEKEAKQPAEIPGTECIYAHVHSGEPSGKRKGSCA